jgi:hypothetical protein
MRQFERISAAFRRYQFERWDKLFKAATEDELRRLIELLEHAAGRFPADSEFTTWNWADDLGDTERDEARRLLTTLETRVKAQADGNPTPPGYVG